MFDRGPTALGTANSLPGTLLDRFAYAPGVPPGGPETVLLTAVGLLAAGILLAAPGMWSRLGRRVFPLLSLLLSWRLWRPPRFA
ncbi:MAG: hypothetical protein M5U01_04715 [Ardenticatenaceae bacterium]|nr:hypothetical protein [Ardenticatenaceae bacterium]HBY93311.1 hypothetical protein [Chloroflexota bacterium]